MMKPLEEAEQIWKEKRDNQLEVNPEDLQVLVNLFQGQCKKMKEKYGTYSINTPLSNLIVANFKEYFNVSKMHAIQRKYEGSLPFIRSVHRPPKSLPKKGGILLPSKVKYLPF